MSGYISTGTVLDKILANTVQEVAGRKQERPLAAVREAAEMASPPRDMLAALHRETRGWHGVS